MSKYSPWPLLGGVRFALACIVVLSHLPWFIPVLPARLAVLPGPFAAVIGFLFISGYSIAASIERAPRGFYLRRLRRIYPTYALALGVSLLPFVLAGQSAIAVPGYRFVASGWVGMLGNALLLQTFAVHPLGGNPPLWSLSVECACYALAPLLLRLRSRVILGALGASLVFYLICRQVLGLPHYPYSLGGEAFAAVLWAWLAGFLFYRHRTTAWAGYALALVAPITFALNPTDATRLSGVITAATALALVYAPHIPLPPRLSRLLAWVGDASYPLYLLHVPVLLLLWMVWAG